MDVNSASDDQRTLAEASIARDGSPDGQDGSADSGAGPNLATYRDAVSDLVEAVRSQQATTGRLEKLIAAGLIHPELSQVLGRLPGGVDAVTTNLIRETQAFRPNGRSSANDIPSLVRVYLLSQIDTLWWSGVQPFETDRDVATSPELVDLGPLRSRDQLRFQYRSRPDGIAGRAVDLVASRAFPTRWPRPGHLRFARTRPEAIAFVNQLAVEVIDVTGGATPPLWVTSLVRSVQHQRRLRAQGFAALLPSSHCVGYSIDIELQWFRQFDENGALPSLLLDHQTSGEVNVINEGPAWHVCLNPTHCDELARTYRTGIGPLPGGDPRPHPRRAR